eukprot:1104793-Pelagomonas_calceolata.AAC.3
MVVYTTCLFKLNVKPYHDARQANTGFTPASIEPATRAGIECACCEICNYPGSKQPLNSEPDFKGGPLNSRCKGKERNIEMYICDVCHQKHHWTCVRELKCYTNEQRQDIDIDYYWACPACAHLNGDYKTQ